MHLTVGIPGSAKGHSSTDGSGALDYCFSQSDQWFRCWNCLNWLFVCSDDWYLVCYCMKDIA